MEEQACLMWFLSTIAFNPQYSVNNIQITIPYVQRCIIFELTRFSAAYNREMSGEYPFLINTDHFVEKTNTFDRKLLLTSLGITLVLSSNNTTKSEDKLMPIQLILALSFLTLEKSNTNEIQRGNSVKNNVINRSRDGLCILGFCIACQEFKRLLATSEGQSDAVDCKAITHAHPIILDLLKKSLNSLKFRALHCAKEFDFGNTRVADLDASFYSIAPLFLTKAIRDITLSLINIKGQSYGQQPNHMNGVSLLLKADKVIIEQDIVRTKPITGTTNSNASSGTLIQQEGLVGSWLTCILWEPLVRAAVASKDIPLFENDEFFSAEGRRKCMEIISSKGVVPTINRLFLESWPTCMISLTIMSKSKLGRIIKAFEMFELVSSIQQLLPSSFQHFMQFGNYVRSQLLLSYQRDRYPTTTTTATNTNTNTNDNSRDDKYDTFTKNVQYYLTNFFQLVSLSKEKIPATTKVTHTNNSISYHYHYHYYYYFYY